MRYMRTTIVGIPTNLKIIVLPNVKNCAQKDQCPMKELKKDNTVRINKTSIQTAEEREKIKTDKKGNTSKRAAIEGTNSALKSQGLGKLRVRGKAKCKIVCGLKVIAQNVKRVIKYIQGGYKKVKNTNLLASKGVVCP